MNKVQAACKLLGSTQNLAGRQGGQKTVNMTGLGPFFPHWTIGTCRKTDIEPICGRGQGHLKARESRGQSSLRKITAQRAVVQLAFCHILHRN